MSINQIYDSSTGKFYTRNGTQSIDISSGTDYNGILSYINVNASAKSSTVGSQNYGAPGTVSIGYLASCGPTGAGSAVPSSVFIGDRAGFTDNVPSAIEATNIIAIGNNALTGLAEEALLEKIVAIGQGAGANLPADLANGVFIGYSTGAQSAVLECVVLNGQGEGNALVADQTGFFVAPVRGVEAGMGLNVMLYNSATGEIFYSTN